MSVCAMPHARIKRLSIFAGANSVVGIVVSVATVTQNMCPSAAEAATNNTPLTDGHVHFTTQNIKEI